MAYVCLCSHELRRNGFCDLLFETREERRSLQDYLPQAEGLLVSVATPHLIP